MQSGLRILYLEDDPNDAELAQAALEMDGIVCEIERVETAASYIGAIHQGGFDLILADYTLPSFDGLSALQVARRDAPQIPFIFVSGTLDEEIAIEALKHGATDYVFKTRLSRISPSVTRALREANERLELIRSEEALRRSEAYLAEAQRLSHTGSFGWDVESGEVYWSEETFRIFECEQTRRIAIELVVERTHPEDRAMMRERVGRGLQEKDPFDFEHRLLMPDGSVKYVRVVGQPVRTGSGQMELVGAVTDITERRRNEVELRRALDEIKQLRDQLYRENIALREEVDKTSMFEEIVGESPALRSVLSRVEKVSPSDSTVLITGETGTGKELIARAIHKRSRRASRAFVSVNCAATPVALIASELFGHEKGAFTGALQRRLGRFEVAEGGTIFLDEVGELPSETQIMLLRVLQEREFDRIGGNEPIRADVRVIAATNRNLEKAIGDSAFRSDLFYRLNVFPIELPALRERREDIPTLIEYFIHRYSRKAGKRFRSIEKSTMQSLQSYDWPGNIRELQNVIERSIIVCESNVFSVDPSWLSVDCAPIQQNSRASSVKSKDVERQAIEAVLAACEGRISGPAGAAAQLNIPASTLESKIRSLKINKFRFKAT